MSIFTLIAGIGPDDWDEYETGAIDQRDRCAHEARILAFGAIRRAAEVAREWDDLADFSFDLLFPSAYYAGKASAIRAAIRAAIGSDKA